MVRNTLRWRLGLPFALLVVLATVVISSYFIQVARENYERTLRDSLFAQSRLLAELVRPYFAANSDLTAIQTVVDHSSQLTGARITVTDPTGVVVAESNFDPAQMENHRDRPEIRAAMDGQENSQTRFSPTLKDTYLYAAVPVLDGGQVVGVARTAMPLSNVETVPQQIRDTVLLVTLGTALGALLLAILVTNLTTRPLVRLTEAVRHMSTGQYSSRPLPASNDEVGQLNQAFNQLSVELQDQFAALRTERGKLEAVLTNMTDGVVIIDEQEIIQLINPAAERIFGSLGQQSIHRSAVEVLRHHQIVELWRAFQETRETQITTLELPTQKLFLQVIATSLGAAIPGAALLLIQDLTRLRRLETVRQDFISNVSHELRTPLAGLKALTETLQEGALEDPPAARRFLGRMEDEIDTLSQMVEELLELSRIESGKVPLKRRSIRPCPLVTPAVDRMRLQAERAGLSLSVDCPDDLPPVFVDPDRVEQVLVNLLHNAIKFTPDGGHISVSSVVQGNWVEFRVADTGIGISPNDLARIFERFYKTDRARSSRGTGLGLSIARHIVEGHGGQIWAESEPNQGSTFIFTFPIARK